MIPPYASGGPHPPAPDLVIRHAGELLTCAAPAGAAGGANASAGAREAAKAPAGPLGVDALGIILDGALAVAGGRIVWLGPDAELEAAVTVRPATRVVDARGRVVMPGVVECHTHVVFGGERSVEFQMRVAGKS
jgi:imidazolonepropionase